MHSENEVELQSCVRPPHTYMYLSQLEVNFVIIIKCMVDKIHTGRPYRGDCKGIDLFNMAFGRERIFENWDKNKHSKVLHAYLPVPYLAKMGVSIGPVFQDYRHSQLKYQFLFNVVIDLSELPTGGKKDIQITIRIQWYIAFETLGCVIIIYLFCIHNLWIVCASG